MFCTHCGTKLEEGQRFCSSCGKTLVTAVAAESRVGQHLTLVGVFWIVISGFRLVGAAMVLAVGMFLFPYIPAEFSPPTGIFSTFGVDGWRGSALYGFCGSGGRLRAVGETFVGANPGGHYGSPLLAGDTIRHSVGNLHSMGVAAGGEGRGVQTISNWRIGNPPQGSAKLWMRV